MMDLRLDDTGFGTIEIYQNPKGFCYGIDAVLLADFAARESKSSGKGQRIMDLGTGTGIVPLLLSEMTKSDEIAGIEMQQASYQIAMKNRTHNGLENRLTFFHRDVKDGPPEGLEGTFDVVTSNPPYTPENCGIESKNQEKALARHETTASLDDFVRCAAELLIDKGSFFMVHRPARLVDICESCRKNKLEPKKIQFISGKIGEKPNILLVQCIKNGNRELRLLDPIFVHNEDGSYSNEICRIYHK
ncbi:tRNA1Val (adenine37-N6)-methyltransferase [Clostridiales Family XIII bacterium PM5-7]